MHQNKFGSIAVTALALAAALTLGACGKKVGDTTTPGSSSSPMSSPSSGNTGSTGSSGATPSGATPPAKPASY